MKNEFARNILEETPPEIREKVREDASSARLAYLEKRDIFLIELEHWLDIQIEVAKRQAKEQEHFMNEIIFNTKAKTLQEDFDKIKTL